MAITQLGFSARAYDRVLKVSPTVADLAGEDTIREEHVSEAIQYRTLDRLYHPLAGSCDLVTERRRKKTCL